jgi:formylglycine-generating enzyme required for sulfatase activity
VDADLALNSFLRQYLADSEAGAKHTISLYQRLYPGHESLIAEEFARLEAGASARQETRFGRYRILRELGRGGQGVVHLALDTQLNRQVALKVLTAIAAFSDDLLKRFRREAEVASRIDHPGICAVFDAGEQDRMPYIAMRYVDGETLARRIASAREEGATGLPPTAPTIELIEKAARALHAAHEAGVLHRDIKPGNLMITKAGEPVILDFGLARALDSEGHDLTRTGDSFGTPSYMSPEQVSGAPLDARTDVYSLGATLYEALTLRRPYEEPTREKLYHAICSRRPIDPRRLNPAIKGDLAIVLSCALETERARRYQSALDFAEDLRRVREFEPIRARPVGPLVHLASWARRNPALASALGALFVLLVTALAVTLGLYRDASRERDSKDVALGLVERLSDVKRLEELQAAAEDLWPAVPATVPAMKAWLERAATLEHALPGHRSALAALRQSASAAPGPSGGEYSFPSTEQQWHHDTLARLVRDLERFFAPDLSSGLVAGVRKRLEFAESVENETLVKQRENWTATIAAIAAEPRYAGLRIPAQLGLVPVGRDPASGLFEFAHLQTGAVPARGADGKLAFDASSGVVLVLVPGGTFRMGAVPHGEPMADQDVRGDELPPVEVTLDAFFISKFEMTQGQWKRATGSHPGPDESPDCPLRHATYDECERTLERLGLLVPTEAQWEYAARGKTTTPWWTGPETRSIGGAANVADKSVGEFGPKSWLHESWLDDGYANVAPVGRFRANPFGLHDVIGNLWEVCRDHYGPYSASKPRPGDGLREHSADKSSDARVARGGSYIYGGVDARSARRSSTTPNGRSVYNGVRPARRIQ